MRSLWSLTLDHGPLGGPQLFFNVNAWLEAFGEGTVAAMLETFDSDDALAPVAESVRGRGVEKLHRVRIADVFASEPSAQTLRAALNAAMQNAAS